MTTENVGSTLYIHPQVVKKKCPHSKGSIIVMNTKKHVVFSSSAEYVASILADLLQRVENMIYKMLTEFERRVGGYYTARHHLYIEVQLVTFCLVWGLGAAGKVKF